MTFALISMGIGMVGLALAGALHAWRAGWTSLRSPGPVGAWRRSSHGHARFLRRVNWLDIDFPGVPGFLPIKPGSLMLATHEGEPEYRFVTDLLRVSVDDYIEWSIALAEGARLVAHVGDRGLQFAVPADLVWDMAEGPERLGAPRP